MRRTLALLLFAAASAGNGVYRIVSDPEGGKTGLIFGLVMAALTGVSALLIRGEGVRRIAALALGWAAVLMTGGFFIFAMTSKPDDYGMARPALMVAASLATAVALVLGDGPPADAPTA